MDLTLGQTNWQSILTRGLIFSFFWWVLTQGDAASWKFGAPVVLVATLLSAFTVPPAHLRWLQAMRLIPFFVKRSLLGATDVALRALQRSVSLQPILIEYRLTMPPGLPRMVLLNIISLLPGTLCADIRGDTLLVHVLDGNTDYRRELAEVEQAVARLYGGMA